MTDISILTRYAYEVRNYLGGTASGNHLEMLKRFPAGCCKVASLLLLQWLHDQAGVCDAQCMANARRPNPKTPDEDATHFWIEIGDVIIDITSDQFTDSPQAVIVSRDRTWHQSFSGICRFPQSGLIPLSNDHMREYKVMASTLKGTVSKAIQADFLRSIADQHGERSCP